MDERWSSLFPINKPGPVNRLLQYVNNFLLVFNNTDTLKIVKRELRKEYNVKDLGKIKIIIGWQIMRNPFIQTLKIDQFSFICNFIIKENLINCNSNVIPIKADCIIEIIKHNNYKDIEIKPY